MVGPFHLVAPATQCNTDTAPGGPSNPLNAGTVRTVQVSGLANVPQGAAAAVINVTDVAPTGPSYLTIFPQGTAPTTSDVNAPVGEVDANLTVATLATSGSFNVFDGGSGTTNLVVDVAGWYIGSDSLAQSALDQALNDAEFYFQANGQSFSIARVVGLEFNDPTLAWTTGASTAHNQISVLVSADWEAIILAAQAENNGNCWYVVYNAVTEASWSTAGAVYAGAGTWYGELKDTGTPPTCAAFPPPVGPNNSTQEFLTSGFPNL